MKTFFDSMQKRIKHLCKTRPKPTFTVVMACVTAAVILIVLLAMARNTWRIYAIRPLGISVELPAEPRAVEGSRNASATVYEANTPELAVVLASFPSEPGVSPTQAELVKRSITYLAGTPGIDGLRVEVQRGKAQGQPVWHVSGIFGRQGVPCRVVGNFVVGSGETWQIFCLFQAKDSGPKMAGRVLRSAKYGGE